MSLLIGTAYAGKLPCTMTQSRNELLKMHRMSPADICIQTGTGKNYIYIQSAQKAIITHHDKQYYLTLLKVNNNVMVFSGNRPSNSMGQISIQKFLTAWSSGQYRFSTVYSPNFGMTYYNEKLNKIQKTVFQVINDAAPHYNEPKHKVVYKIKVIGKALPIGVYFKHVSVVSFNNCSPPVNTNNENDWGQCDI